MFKFKEKFLMLSEFSKNVITLMTGTILAQALPIAISPILTRLYSPDDFGVFALFMSLTSIFGIIITARYELSIMLPKSSSDAANLVVLSLSIAFLLSIILLIVVCVFNDQIVRILGNTDLKNWLYFVPLSILLTGVYQSLNYWSNRNKKYKRLATAKVIQSSMKGGANIGFGFINIGAIGLVFGSIIGKLFSTLFLFFLVKKNNNNFFEDVSMNRMKQLAKKYDKFAKYDLPASISYSLYSNMAVVFFNKFFESAISGFYFFANRLLKVPFSFFISAFSDVFYQKLSKTIDLNIISKEVNNYSIKLLKFTIIPFLLIVYSSYFYAGFVFGDAWSDLWKYMYIFSLPIYIALILSPYGHVLKVVNRQEVSMFLHFFRLLIIGGYFISYFFIEFDFIWFLLIFSILDSSIHIILGFFVDKIIENQKTLINFLYRVIVLIVISFINFKLIVF